MQILTAFAPFIIFPFIDRIFARGPSRRRGSGIAVARPRHGGSKAVAQNPGRRNDDLVLRIVALFLGGQAGLVGKRRPALRRQRTFTYRSDFPDASEAIHSAVRP